VAERENESGNQMTKLDVASAVTGAPPATSEQPVHTAACSLILSVTQHEFANHHRLARCVDSIDIYFGLREYDRFGWTSGNVRHSVRRRLIVVI
jgi:hypothetical protein